MFAPALDAAESQGAPQRGGTSIVFAFFGLTFLLTGPIWLLGALRDVSILPGLPLAALAVVCPAVSALVLSWSCGGAASARACLAGAFDIARVRSAWWLPILLISPAVGLAAFLILRIGGSEVPEPDISVFPTMILCVVFLASALCEEIGWTGFALAPLQARLGWLGAALAIGAVWAIWHVPALIEAHRSASWIGWWALGTLATRVIMVWLFNGGGRSVFGVAVFHAAGNLGWQLFPVHGSWFNPRLNGVLLTAIACFAVACGSRGSLSAPRRAVT